MGESEEGDFREAINRDVWLNADNCNSAMRYATQNFKVREALAIEKVKDATTIMVRKWSPADSI